MAKRILITGANRGLGYELTRQYVQRGEQVFAACRKPDDAEALQTLKEQHPETLVIVPLEVTDAESIAQSVELVKQHTEALDMLINNAGIIYREANFSEITAQHLRETFEVNTIAPVIVAQHYLDLIKAGEDPMIINVSSRGGSIGLRHTVSNASYAASKAALNMISKMMANEFTPEGILVVPMHPGWVQTDMGGPEAALQVEEAMTTMIKTLDKLNPKKVGYFMQWDGGELPW